MSELNGKYGLLPKVPEHIVDKILNEVSDFASFMKHDPDGAKRHLDAEINWLKENKDFLGKAIEASVDSALDLYSETLTHKDWIELRTFLLKGALLILQTINETLRESWQSEATCK
jgi:hypothetical protein